MGIMLLHGFEFVTFLLEIDSKKWWRAYVEYLLLVLPPLTRENIYTLFLDKYVSWALCDPKKDKFLALE